MQRQPSEVEEWPVKVKFSISIKYLITPPCVRNSNNCRYFIFLVGPAGKITEMRFEQSIASKNK
jgi:hypothetical protein